MDRDKAKKQLDLIVDRLTARKPNERRGPHWALTRAAIIVHVPKIVASMSIHEIDRFRDGDLSAMERHIVRP